MNSLIVVGTGSGMPDYILPCAKDVLLKTESVIASERISEGLGIKDAYRFGGIGETIALCRKLLKWGDVAVAVSGDPLMYSFLSTIQKKMSDVPVTVIPSVGALQLIGAKFGITMEDARIISIHGREVDESVLVREVSENEKVFFFCDEERNPAYIADVLVRNRLGGVTVCTASDLTYPEETADLGTAEEIAQRSYAPLSMAVVINKNARKIPRHIMLSDSDFERTIAPMTKEEVRAVVMLKLGVTSNAVVWDIGAGTGSISVECARSAVYGSVYSVERNTDAIHALELNRNKFGLENMSIICEEAADAIKELPVPDFVFIGGSGSTLPEIFEYIMSIDKRIRVVLSAVTFETKASAYELMKELDGFDMVEVSVSRRNTLGPYTIMEPNNPVMIMSAYTKGLE